MREVVGNFRRLLTTSLFIYACYIVRCAVVNNLLTMLLITLLITYWQKAIKIFGLYLFLALSLQSHPKRNGGLKTAKKKFFEKSSPKIWRVLEKGIIFAPLSLSKTSEGK